VKNVFGIASKMFIESTKSHAGFAIDRINSKFLGGIAYCFFKSSDELNFKKLCQDLRKPVGATAPKAPTVDSPPISGRLKSPPHYF
jgi:hypothetical protein